MQQSSVALKSKDHSVVQETVSRAILHTAQKCFKKQQAQLNFWNAAYQ